MPITQLSKTAGTVGDDFVITGSGFVNATGVRFTGPNNTLIPAPQLVQSDTSILASVPAGAITGPITVTDPDGDHVSPMNFSVLQQAAGTAAENTPRGREALNALVLAMAARTRNDKITVAQTFDREVILRENDGNSTVLSRPSGADVTPAQVAGYQDQLFNLMPSSFNLDKMVIAGTSVLVVGKNAGGTTGYTISLRQTSGGFVIYALGSDDI